MSSLVNVGLFQKCLNSKLTTPTKNPQKAKPEPDLTQKKHGSGSDKQTRAQKVKVDMEYSLHKQEGNQQLELEKQVEQLKSDLKEQKKYNNDDMAALRAFYVQELDTMERRHQSEKDKTETHFDDTLKTLTNLWKRNLKSHLTEYGMGYVAERVREISEGVDNDFYSNE
jgi:phage-related protein